MEKSGILERKAIIKNADMTEDMQQDAIECATAVWSTSPSAFSSCFTCSSYIQCCLVEFCLGLQCVVPICS